VLAIGRNDERESRLETLVTVSNVYGIGEREARARIDAMVDSMIENWTDAADFARLDTAARGLLWGRAFLHPAVRFEHEAVKIPVSFEPRPSTGAADDIPATSSAEPSDDVGANMPS
jgi:hypothetical protein